MISIHLKKLLHGIKSIYRHYRINFFFYCSKSHLTHFHHFIRVIGSRHRKHLVVGSLQASAKISPRIGTSASKKLSSPLDPPPRNRMQCRRTSRTLVLHIADFTRRLGIIYLYTDKLREERGRANFFGSLVTRAHPHRWNANVDYVTAVCYIVFLFFFLLTEVYKVRLFQKSMKLLE